MRDEPNQSFPLKLGDKTFNLTLKDVIYDATKGDFHHPNTMTAKLMAGDTVLFEQEYYSVGGGFIEWKGYTPPKKNPPKYPFRTMKELRTHADSNKTTIAKIMLANEMSIAGRSEEEVNAFIDKIIDAMVATVKSGLSMSEDDVLPGPMRGPVGNVEDDAIRPRRLVDELDHGAEPPGQSPEYRCSRHGSP